MCAWISELWTLAFSESKRKRITHYVVFITSLTVKLIIVVQNFRIAYHIGKDKQLVSHELEIRLKV